MTQEVMDYVKGLNLKGKCLDVGSFNVNGCVREFFPEYYIGLDMRPGPNVDIVAQANALPFLNGIFDVVTCLEMLEHDRDMFGSIREMKRVLKPGGALVLTVPGIGFPKHDYPSDYWRITGDGLRVLFDGMERVEIKETFQGWGHVFGHGFMPKA